MTRPIPVAGVSSTPFYVRGIQDWDITQERYRRDQAVWSIGEAAYFVMMWSVEDFDSGLVTRCTRCYESDDINARIASVYNQPLQARCPECYGTTFDGGVRARIIRPAIFTDADDDEIKSSRGVTHAQHLTVESTNDFRTRSGDYVFRQDGSRWQLGTPVRDTLRTGFAHNSQAEDSLGYARMPASLEDRSSVAYMLQPNRDQIEIDLTSPSRYPATTKDVLNGPLIPPRSYTD